jgi:hypothetical protein
MPASRRLLSSVFRLVLLIILITRVPARAAVCITGPADTNDSFAYAAATASALSQARSAVQQAKTIDVLREQYKDPFDLTREMLIVFQRSGELFGCAANKLMPFKKSKDELIRSASEAATMGFLFHALLDINMSKFLRQQLRAKTRLSPAARAEWMAKMQRDRDWAWDSVVMSMAATVALLTDSEHSTSDSRHLKISRKQQDALLKSLAGFMPDTSTHVPESDDPATVAAKAMHAILSTSVTVD